MPRRQAAPAILDAVSDLRGQRDAYRIQGPVARGRSGDVLRAMASDGSTVALKVHHQAEDGWAEAERLAAIDHPGLVDLLDHGSTPDGRLWLALPWIDGRTLSHLLLDDGPVSQGEALDLVAQIADAVDAVHTAGLVHGDLSPNNVLVDDAGRAVLIDLGAARSVDEPSDRSARPVGGDTTGLEVEATPRYASPEVAAGQLPGPAADRYALGLVAYELLTGSFPYPEVATPIAMLGHHATTEPALPSEHRPDLPPVIDAALLWALAKDPDQRPTTGADLVDALRGLSAPPEPATRVREPAGVRFSHQGWGRFAAWLAIVPLIAVVAWLWTRFPLSGPEAPLSPEASIAASTDSPWPAGRAAGLACNLLDAPGFESEPVPDGFYGADPSNLVTRVPGAGVDGGAALRVGASGQFGLFGEIVPVTAGQEYVLSAWARRQGDPGTTAFFVDYLDAQYTEITAARTSLGPDQQLGGPSLDGTGGRTEVRSKAPADAAFAVPTFFKDGSPGSLLIDEVVFGPIAGCGDLTS